MDYDDHYIHSGINVQKEKIVKKEIAFFDFDGTITTKDTLFEFIKFSKGKFLFFLGFIINLPYLIAYKLKLISNQSAKEKILRFFFQGMSSEVFSDYGKSFSKYELPKLLRPKALEEIRHLQEKNVVVVVVSASPENWIENWANESNVELVASRLEVREGKLTGKILGKNCHGTENVNRICEIYNLSDYSIIAAYGDTQGDKPMLQLAKKAYYKPFI
jgi:HAD superfamily hydrolase (TIGR01490 family)